MQPYVLCGFSLCVITFFPLKIFFFLETKLESIKFIYNILFEKKIQKIQKFQHKKK